VKMRLMGVSGPTEVKRLSEEQAVNRGTEIIGELVIYAIASSAIVAEYYRSSRKDKVAEDSQDEKISKLSERLNKLDMEMKTVRTQLDKLEQSKPKKSK